jgi:hypothetical protein
MKLPDFKKNFLLSRKWISEKDLYYLDLNFASMTNWLRNWITYWFANKSVKDFNDFWRQLNKTLWDSWKKIDADIKSRFVEFRENIAWDIQSKIFLEKTLNWLRSFGYLKRLSISTAIKQFSSLEDWLAEVSKGWLWKWINLSLSSSDEQLTNLSNVLGSRIYYWWEFTTKNQYQITTEGWRIKWEILDWISKAADLQLQHIQLADSFASKSVWIWAMSDYWKTQWINISSIKQLEDLKQNSENWDKALAYANWKMTTVMGSVSKVDEWALSKWINRYTLGILSRTNMNRVLQSVNNIKNLELRKVWYYAIWNATNAIIDVTKYWLVSTYWINKLNEAQEKDLEEFTSWDKWRSGNILWT